MLLDYVPRESDHLAMPVAAAFPVLLFGLLCNSFF